MPHMEGTNVFGFAGTAEDLTFKTREMYETTEDRDGCIYCDIFEANVTYFQVCKTSWGSGGPHSMEHDRRQAQVC